MKCNFKRLLSNRVKKFSKIRNFLARPCKCGRLTTTSISWDCVWLNFTSRYSVVTNCYFMQVVWRNFFFRWKIEKIFFFSIVNRYIEEHVQRTGVAIETQGFTFVTSGKKRESLTVSFFCNFELFEFYWIFFFFFFFIFRGMPHYIYILILNPLQSFQVGHEFDYYFNQCLVFRTLYFC